VHSGFSEQKYWNWSGKIVLVYLLQRTKDRKTELTKNLRSVERHVSHVYMVL